MKKENIKWLFILHLIILIYSINGISSKMAASYDFLSKEWIFFYGIVIALLGFYAIAWQQILKHLPLITSYANKAVTTIWGLVWGTLVFHETITIERVIGAAVVIFGVYLVVTGDEEITGKSDSDEPSKEVSND